MSTLDVVTFALPETNSNFLQNLGGLFSPLVQIFENGITINPSHPNFLPKLILKETQIILPEVIFETNSKIITTIKLQNDTGQTKLSPHQYKGITLAEAILRLQDYNIVAIDHLGFNLPWFGNNIHPQIQILREQLSTISLYHQFPTGEQWDFILPGSQAEIEGQQDIDYNITRKPKLELVSFAKASTPLIQIDFSIDATYAEIATLFPEAITVPENKNIWVYLENPYGIDICLVINQPGKADWSGYFAGSRLKL